MFLVFPVILYIPQALQLTHCHFFPDYNKQTLAAQLLLFPSVAPASVCNSATRVLCAMFNCSFLFFFEVCEFEEVDALMNVLARQFGKVVEPVGRMVAALKLSLIFLEF